MYFLQTRTFSRLYLGAHKVHVHPQVDVRKLWHRTILSCPADDFKHAVCLWNDNTQSLPIEFVRPIGTNKSVNIYTSGAQWLQLAILISNNKISHFFSIWTINLSNYWLRKSLHSSGISLRHNKVKNTMVMWYRNKWIRPSFPLNSPLCKRQRYMLKPEMHIIYGYFRFERQSGRILLKFDKLCGLWEHCKIYILI